MKGKKIVCFILCMVLAFTLLSGPWRAEAEAAAIAIPLTVLGIVGLFVVSSGYTFASVGDFSSAVTDFCQKNFNMTNGAAFRSVLDTIIPDSSGAIALAAALQCEYFPEFWQAIKDFFGGGEVEVEVNEELPDGFANYNGHLLPQFGNNNKNSYIEKTSYRLIFRSRNTGVYYLSVNLGPWTYNSSMSRDNYDIYNINHYTTAGCSVAFYSYTIDDSSWTYVSSSNSTAQLKHCTDGDNWIAWPTTLSNGGNDAIWISHTLDGVLEATEIVTSGNIVLENIPISVDSTYDPTAVYNGWMSRVEAEPWMTYDATSAVFQDITTAETDKTAPMTATQTGVISQAGVQVQTETDVVIPEYTGEYVVNGLTSIFPFCIPFDIYDFFSVLVAEREAPHFEFNIDFGKYGAVPVNIDLSEWEPVAKVLRTLELLGFIVGLAWATSKLIKW